MNLHIKSGIWYDVEVAVKVGDKVDKQLLKEEGYCDFCIDRTAGSEVIIHFDERTKNPFFRILLGIVKTLFNFLYYCFSNDSFDTPHPLDENLNFIKTVSYTHLERENLVKIEEEMQKLHTLIAEITEVSPLLV